MFYCLIVRVYFDLGVEIALLICCDLFAFFAFAVIVLWCVNSVVYAVLFVVKG